MKGPCSFSVWVSVHHCKTNPFLCYWRLRFRADVLFRALGRGAVSQTVHKFGHAACLNLEDCTCGDYVDKWVGKKTLLLAGLELLDEIVCSSEEQCLHKLLKSRLLTPEAFQIGQHF